MPVPLLLEIAADSLACALAAQQGGADRLELCGNLTQGGVTPSYGLLTVVRDHLDIPLYVLIRPRTGDFFYEDAEFEIMQRDIEICVQLGCDGVVIGALNVHGKVDPRCHELIKSAGKLGVTFHRAFDASVDLSRSLEEVILLGCERVLTSGGCATAVQGANIIAELVQQSSGRIAIMAGAGVRSQNLSEIAQISGIREFHSSARTAQGSLMQYTNSALQDLSSYIERTDIAQVSAMKRQLSELEKSR